MTISFEMVIPLESVVPMSRWKHSDLATPFGSYVLQRMHVCHLTKFAVSQQLGILPDHFNRVLVSPHTAIELPLLKKLADILRVSWVELSLNLYDQTSSGTSEEDVRSILLFDQFYRLAPADQEVVLGLAEKLLKVNGERPLSPEQQQSLASLRMAPTCVKRGGPPRGSKAASA